MKVSSAHKTLIIIGFLNAIATLGYAYVATYIYKVKKTDCTCASDWRQTVMSVYSSFSVVLGVVVLFMCAKGTYLQFRKRLPYFEPVIGLFTLFYLLTSYSYLGILDARQCQCSKDLIIILVYIIKYLNGLLVTYGVTFIVFTIIAAFVLRIAIK